MTAALAHELRDERQTQKVTLNDFGPLTAPSQSPFLFYPIPVVNSIWLASAVESDDLLRDTVFLRDNFRGRSRSIQVRSPSFELTLWSGGIAQVCDVSGAGSRGAPATTDALVNAAVTLNYHYCAMAADYYPIFARAVSRSATNNARARQELYERARTVLLASKETASAPEALGQTSNRLGFVFR